jgi:hypothetical protein
VIAKGSAMLFLAGLLSTLPAVAQEGPASDRKWTEDKEFVIVASARSFTEAARLASDAGMALYLKQDLRGVAEDKKIGLTFSKEECEKNNWDFPCYVPRGRFDDGIWVSVEHSSGYEGFAPRLYLIIIASAPVHDPMIKVALDMARKQYPKAYAKRAAVYMDCIH